MRSQNSGIADDTQCLYVGATAHRPDCRFQQHLLWAADEDSFPCSCWGDSRAIFFRGRGPNGEGRTRGNKALAGKYGKYLRARLFKKYNPLPSKEEALEFEEQLAIDLRQDGYAAYQR